MPDVRNKSRQKRLGAALRENLKRRKEQVRGRATPPGPDMDEAGESARQIDGDVPETSNDEPERPA